MSNATTIDEDAYAALVWFLEAGVDECLLEDPVDRYEESAETLKARLDSARAEGVPLRQSGTGGRSDGGSASAFPPGGVWSPAVEGIQSNEEALADARRLAAEADDLEALSEAIRGFEGCALRKTATHSVVARGNPKADVMLIGDYPRKEDDREGQPFMGAPGQLLDRMMAAIGLDSETTYLSNCLFWRPPGGSRPKAADVALCLPFVERMIELAAPRYLILLGEVPTRILLGENVGSRPIARLRGRWFPYEHAGMSAPIPALATFHPDTLLRQPGYKRLSWRDLLVVQGVLKRGAPAYEGAER